MGDDFVGGAAEDLRKQRFEEQCGALDNLVIEVMGAHEKAQADLERLQELKNKALNRKAELEYEDEALRANVSKAHATIFACQNLGDRCLPGVVDDLKARAADMLWRRGEIQAGLATLENAEDLVTKAEAEVALTQEALDFVQNLEPADMDQNDEEVSETRHQGADGQAPAGGPQGSGDDAGGPGESVGPPA